MSHTSEMHSPLETLSSAEPVAGKDKDDQRDESVTGILCSKAGSKHAETVSKYFTALGRNVAVYLYEDDRFSPTVEGVTPHTRFYILVDNIFHRLLLDNLKAIKQILRHVKKSTEDLYFVNFLEDDEDFGEVRYNLPREVRTNFVPKEKFVHLSNGKILKTGNNNNTVQIGDNNTMYVHPSEEVRTTQIGGNISYQYDATIEGFVLTIKTPEANHQLDVTIKKHVDDNLKHINVTLKDLHAEVMSTELGSVIIRVRVEQGTKLGADWLKRLITTILSENILSSLPVGTRMEISIQASVPLQPLDVDIFDVVKDEASKCFWRDANKTGQGRGKTLLHLAAALGLVDIVQKLLSSGVDPNLQTQEGDTPLHEAVINDTVEVVKLLTKNGAKINVKNLKSLTPLQLAARENRVACIELIMSDMSMYMTQRIDKTSNITMDHTEKKSVLHRIILMLLKSDSDVNAKDKDGNTALHIAAARGNLEIIDTLMEFGADAKSVNISCKSPLHVAFENKNYLCGLNIAECDPESLAITDNNGNTFIQTAIVGISPIIKEEGFVLKLRADKSPLHIAVEREHIDSVRTLIRLGSDVNAKDDKSCTPLLVAIKKVFKDDYIEKNKHYFKLLVKLAGQQGVLNSQNHNGDTALHMACSGGDEELVNCLLYDGKADVKIVNSQKETVLHCLAKSKYRMRDLVYTIVEHGADINAKDANGEIAFQVAERNRNFDVYFALLEAGTYVRSTGQTITHYPFQSVKMLEEMKVDQLSRMTSIRRRFEKSSTYMKPRPRFTPATDIESKYTEERNRLGKDTIHRQVKAMTMDRGGTASTRDKQKEVHENDAGQESLIAENLLTALNKFR